MSVAGSQTVERVVEDEPRSAMVYRIAELKKGLAERDAALGELRTRVQLELQAAELRTSLARAEGVVQVARAQLQIEKVRAAHEAERAAHEAERAARERAEAELRSERARFASLAQAVAEVPWWAPWRRRRIAETLTLLPEA